MGPTCQPNPGRLSLLDCDTACGYRMKLKQTTKREYAEQVAVLRRRMSDMEWTEGECRRLKDTLRKSEEAFRKLVHQSVDAILIMDSVSHHVVDANPRACALLGYSRQQLISTSASAVYPDHFPQFQVFARSVSETGHGRTDQIKCST